MSYRPCLFLNRGEAGSGVQLHHRVRGPHLRVSGCGGVPLPARPYIFLHQGKGQSCEYHILLTNLASSHDPITQGPTFPHTIPGESYKYSMPLAISELHWYVSPKQLDGVGDCTTFSVKSDIDISFVVVILIILCLCKLSFADSFLQVTKSDGTILTGIYKSNIVKFCIGA